MKNCLRGKNPHRNSDIHLFNENILKGYNSRYKDLKKYIGIDCGERVG